jgi:hypothetical protein
MGQADFSGFRLPQPTPNNAGSMSWRFLRFRTLWSHTITEEAKHSVISFESLIKGNTSITLKTVYFFDLTHTLKYRFMVEI